MREIKFRAWDKNSGVMLYPPKCWASSNKNKFQLVSEHGNFIIGDEYVMQYTGLKDKNSKEIYHKDIIKTPNENEELYTIGWFQATASWVLLGNETGKVRWIENRNEFSSDFTIDISRCELQGNEYENKELLQCK